MSSDLVLLHFILILLELGTIYENFMYIDPDLS